MRVQQAEGARAESRGGAGEQRRKVGGAVSWEHAGVTKTDCSRGRSNVRTLVVPIYKQITLIRSLIYSRANSGVL
jgi:hypothetical protein